MAAIELAPGRALCAGRYRLERRLGAGGMATVWRARDEHLDRPVAVKILSDTLASDESYVARFRREARVAASLSHPRLVGIFDYGAEGGRPFLVMELVDGPTLGGLLGDGEPVDLDTRELAGDLLAALAHVHEAGIVHRDVKPANVLMAPDGRARLTDFGVAQPPDATELTGTGLLIGTLRYLAPEVVEGHAATVRSDLFALGRLLREVADAARSPSGPELGALIEWLLREDAAQRPHSARDAMSLLDPAAAPTARVPRRRRATPRAPAIAASAPTAATGALLPRRAARGRAAATRERARSAAPRLTVRRPGSRLLAPLAAVLVAAALIAAVALAGSSGGGSGTPRPPRPSAPLTVQLDAIGRALDSTGR